MFTCLRMLEKNIIYPIQTRQYITRIGILGAPFSKGQTKNGVDEAPDALRRHGLIDQLQELDVKDYGNINFENCIEDKKIGKLKFPSTVSEACEKVSSAVKKILLDDRKCVTIGGDHSLGIGTVHGHSQVHDVCVLWIDAHADINTVNTTPSGNFHGMSCSFLLKELQKFNKSSPGFRWLSPCLEKHNLAYIGLRDIDEGEKSILMRENILHFTMHDIDRLGIFEVIQRALRAINPTGKLSLHVSFDIDSLDKMIAPSTGTAVHGGLTLREALCIAEEISKIDSFQALDIVEVNPLLGSKEQVTNTLDLAILVLKTFLGYSRQGRLPRDKEEKLAAYLEP